jgi:hypothetical protein
LPNIATGIYETTQHHCQHFTPKKRFRDKNTIFWNKWYLKYGIKMSPRYLNREKQAHFAVKCGLNIYKCYCNCQTTEDFKIDKDVK